MYNLGVGLLICRHMLIIVQTTVHIQRELKIDLKKTINDWN